MSNNLIIHGLNGSVAFCEAQGLAKCFQAYADVCSREEILEVGFNCHSGYTYIALESMLSICSMLGRDVEFLVTDFNDGEEYFFDTYEEAEEFMSNLNK